MLLRRKTMTNLQCIKKQRHHFANKDPYNQSYNFSSSHEQMWALDHKESWELKNWCFQTLESPMDSKEIKPVNLLMRFQSFSSKADEKNWLTGIDMDAGKDWGQEEKRETEEEMVGWHHQLSGHESEQTLGDSEGQESLASAVQGAAKRPTQPSDWTIATCI